MKVLIACEESQEVCKAFRNKGHEAYSCDIIEPSGGHPEWHVLGDAIQTIKGGEIVTMDGKKHEIGKWDLLIAHPPCTYLCSTGQVWTNEEKYGEKAVERKKLRDEAADFFMEFINADCEKICVENPAGVMSTKYRKPTQYVHPYMFGHATSKKTGLWLKNLPCLQPTNVVEPKSSYAYHNLKGANGKILGWNSAEIKKIRSKTFKGIAEAMADQWG